MHTAQDLPESKRIRQRKIYVSRGILLNPVHPCWCCGRGQIRSRYCSEECRRAYIDSVIVKVG